MRKFATVLASAAALAFMSSSAMALCTAKPGGVLGGAAAGAATGAVVGGPVGAAVGGAVGGAVGAAVTPKVCSYVIETDVPTATVTGEVVVGAPLPDAIVLHPIPEYRTYVFADVNGKRVLVDPDTRVVVEVVN